ncbi:MAG TPA: hypothetical protein HPP80_06935 [Rhodospirillaceae bacterium]|nr:hypothetical protein [Rhodospirillaceae bacterium]
MLATGLRLIADRALQPETIPDLSFLGLQSLVRLDKDLALTRTPEQDLQLAYQHHLIGRYNPAPPGDAERWADLVVTIARDAWKVSSTLKATNNEAFYQMFFESVLKGVDPHSHYFAAHQSTPGLALDHQGNAEIEIIIPPDQNLAGSLPEQLPLESQITEGILVATIHRFTDKTSVELSKLLGNAKVNPDFKGVILDLRGNPGGSLLQAVAVADLFMAEGPILSVIGRTTGTSRQFNAKAGEIGEAMPVVVVLDGGSASAAEIVAAALQDSRRGVVVGTNSYGKGTVQSRIRLPNDAILSITMANFASPSGTLLNGLGVIPNLCLNAGEAKRVTESGTIYPSDQEGRKRLRALCPASARGGIARDIEISRQLILDPGLFAQALGHTWLLAGGLEPLR